MLQNLSSLPFDRKSEGNITGGFPKNIILGCYVGNALELFDFAIYGYLAPLFGKLFFSNLDPHAALLSSYAVFGVAFIMRPVGAILFGHLGDRRGRKQALLWSLVCMAVPTALIGVLPVYDQIGVWAPLLLIICRLIQGLSLGGEFSGSIILLTEHSPAHRKGYFSSRADIGSGIGMIGACLAAIMLSTFLTEEQLLTWGWRLPFLASFIFAILGFYVRYHFTESPEFLAQQQGDTKKGRLLWPLKEILKSHKLTLFLATNFLMISATGYFFLSVFVINEANEEISQAYGSFVMLCNMIVMMPAIHLGGILSDKFGQIRCLFAGHLGCVFLAYPLLYALQYGDFYDQLISQGLFAFCLGFCFGPRSSFMAQIFPTSIRYSGVGLSYNLGNAIFGGSAPIACALLVQYTGTIMAPAYYLTVAAVISLTSTVVLWVRWAERETLEERGMYTQTT